MGQPIMPHVRKPQEPAAYVVFGVLVAVIGQFLGGGAAYAFPVIGGVLAVMGVVEWRRRKG
jgi:hypothetical protein